MAPRTFLSILLALAGHAANAQTPEPADLLCVGGRIYTLDPAVPWAEAMAIRGDRFVAVGTGDEIARYRGDKTQVIDLGGRFTLPGFIDTHVHFASAARFLEFNIMQAGSQAEFVDRLRDVVGRLDDGEWITGGFWGAYDQWAEASAGGAKRAKFTPDMRRVAELTADNPVFIRKYDSSEFAVNDAALKSIGIDRDDLPELDGVTFERDEQGHFTGILRGRGAQRLFGRQNLRRLSHARRIAQTVHALGVAASRGVTGVSDMSDDEQLRIWRELSASGELSLRVDFRFTLDRWSDALREKPVTDEWIRIGGLKGHIDGIMGTESARFFEGYSNNSGNRGRWRRLMVDDKGDVVPGKFLGYMLDADRAGLQITVHAIGDEANHLLLNYLEQMITQNGPRDRRFRLVHAQVIAPDDMPRLGELDVLAEVQPFHLSDDMRWMEERIGRERCKGAYAFKSIRDSGAVLVFGSDWPGTSASSYPIDPMLGLYAAVTRQTSQGLPEGGWFPDERISIEDAIRAYTLDAAYASFEEGLKGSIEPGKLADFAVLSRNLIEAEPAEILDTMTWMTVVGGQVVFRRQ